MSAEHDLQQIEAGIYAQRHAGEAEIIREAVAALARLRLLVQREQAEPVARSAETAETRADAETVRGRLHATHSDRHFCDALDRIVAAAVSGGTDNGP